MISGECRVDAIPPGTGQRLSIDGLRLRLDLRIVPGVAGADGCAAAVLRVENANVTTLPGLGLSVPRVYRRVAVGSSLAALAAAVLVWFAGAPREPEEAVAPQHTPGAGPGPSFSARPAGRESVGRRSSAAHASPDAAAERAAARPAPPARALPPASEDPRRGGVPAGNTAAEGPVAANEAPARLAMPQPLPPQPLPPQPGPASAPGPVAGLGAARTRAPGPPPASPALGRADSLDLFADTK